MSDKGITSIYIDITPKRWRITSSYRVLCALQRLSQIRKLGYVPYGIHDGIGTRTSFVFHLVFASPEDKEAYEQDNSYTYLLRKLKRYSKRGGFVFLT